MIQHDMILKFFVCWHVFTTIRTDILVSRMIRFDMISKLMKLVKTFTFDFTFWASIGLHSTVREHVPFQMCSLTKWLLAMDTNVHLFFGVGYHMPLQWSCLAKWLLTFWTNVHLHGKQTRHLSVFGWRGSGTLSSQHGSICRTDKFKYFLWQNVT